MRRFAFMQGSAFVLVTLLATTGCFKQPGSAPGAFAPIAVGTTLPVLQAEGWLNGPEPTSAELAGSVVVIDCWAYW